MAEFKRTAMCDGHQSYEGYGYSITDSWWKVYDDIYMKHSTWSRKWEVRCSDIVARFNNLRDAKDYCRRNPR